MKTPRTTDLRSGRRYRKMRADFIARARQVNAPCWLCGENIDYAAVVRGPLSPELDHALPKSTHPHLVYEPSNFRVAHASCNQSRGARSPEAHRHKHTKRVAAQQNWVAASW